MALAKAQVQMLRQASKGRLEITFSVGDQVLSSTKLLTTHFFGDLHSMGSTSKKLLPKFLGPFRVMKVCSSGVSYQLDLPAGAQQHPTFHVSLQRPYVPSDPLLFPDRPTYPTAQPQLSSGSPRVHKAVLNLVKCVGQPRVDVLGFLPRS
jgi:hypothetical protein